MAGNLGRDRRSDIRDVNTDINALSSTRRYLESHVGPEIGGLNGKQSEGILYLMVTAERVLRALTRIDADIQRIEKMLGEDTIKFEMGGGTISMSRHGDITLATGEASIFMKKDGTIAIKGKDITVSGSGQVQVKASKDLTLKGQKIEAN